MLLRDQTAEDTGKLEELYRFQNLQGVCPFARTQIVRRPGTNILTIFMEVGVDAIVAMRRAVRADDIGRRLIRARVNEWEDFSFLCRL